MNSRQKAAQRVRLVIEVNFKQNLLLNFNLIDKWLTPNVQRLRLANRSDACLTNDSTLYDLWQPIAVFCHNRQQTHLEQFEWCIEAINKLLSTTDTTLQKNAIAHLQKHIPVTAQNIEEILQPYLSLSKNLSLKQKMRVETQQTTVDTRNAFNGAKKQFLEFKDCLAHAQTFNVDYYPPMDLPILSADHQKDIQKLKTLNADCTKTAAITHLLKAYTALGKKIHTTDKDSPALKNIVAMFIELETVMDVNFNFWSYHCSNGWGAKNSDYVSFNMQRIESTTALLEDLNKQIDEPNNAARARLIRTHTQQLLKRNLLVSINHETTNSCNARNKLYAAAINLCAAFTPRTFAEKCSDAYAKFKAPAAALTPNVNLFKNPITLPEIVTVAINDSATQAGTDDAKLSALREIALKRVTHYLEKDALKAFAETSHAFRAARFYNLPKQDFLNIKQLDLFFPCAPTIYAHEERPKTMIHFANQDRTWVEKALAALPAEINHMFTAVPLLHPITQLPVANSAAHIQIAFPTDLKDAEQIKKDFLQNNAALNANATTINALLGRRKSPQKQQLVLVVGNNDLELAKYKEFAGDKVSVFPVTANLFNIPKNDVAATGNVMLQVLRHVANAVHSKKRPAYRAYVEYLAENKTQTAHRSRLLKQYIEYRDILKATGYLDIFSEEYHLANQKQDESLVNLVALQKMLVDLYRSCAKELPKNDIRFQLIMNIISFCNHESLVKRRYSTTDAAPAYKIKKILDQLAAFGPFDDIKKLENLISSYQTDSSHFNRQFKLAKKLASQHEIAAKKYKATLKRYVNFKKTTNQNIKFNPAYVNLNSFTIELFCSASNNSYANVAKVQIAKISAMDQLLNAYIDLAEYADQQPNGSPNISKLYAIIPLVNKYSSDLADTYTSTLVYTQEILQLSYVITSTLNVLKNPNNVTAIAELADTTARTRMPFSTRNAYGSFYGDASVYEMWREFVADVAKLHKAFTPKTATEKLKSFYYAFFAEKHKPKRLFLNTLGVVTASTLGIIAVIFAIVSTATPLLIAGAVVLPIIALVNLAMIARELMRFFSKPKPSIFPDPVVVLPAEKGVPTAKTLLQRFKAHSASTPSAKNDSGVTTAKPLQAPSISTGNGFFTPKQKRFAVAPANAATFKLGR